LFQLIDKQLGLRQSLVYNITVLGKYQDTGFLSIPDRLAVVQIASEPSPLRSCPAGAQIF